ncbi:MAG: Gfo/Idh/MocA family oxidoreductase [Oscillospiraceae bacterium]|nr:Gfo/Idh/MocA family oxidoreductase [Oscillospiraceae bacterium]
MYILKYGMVGGGEGAFIGDAHRKSINLDGKARLISGCFSRNWDNTLKTGEKLGVDPERLYKDYAEMAKAEAARSDKIDFVVVVTPNSSHFAVCKAFLEAGINVVCDKPLVFEIAEAEELMRIAKEKELLFAVTYTYSGHITFKHVREIIKAGEIGDVRMVMGEYAQGWLYSGDGGKQGSWRIDPGQSGISNALGDIGTHVENSVSMMTGLKIKRVLAKMDAIVPGRTLDDNSVVLVEYENGASGTYWVSQFAIGCDNDLKVRIFGSKGSIEWSQFGSEDVFITGEDGIRKLLRRGYGAIAPNAARYGRLPAAHNEGYLEAMANIYSNFCDCVIKQSEGTLAPEDIDYPGLEEGLDGVKFIHKCVESSKNGNVWVDFD